jgi:outer membrane protein assembly factor BamB
MVGALRSLDQRLIWANEMNEGRALAWGLVDQRRVVLLSSMGLDCLKVITGERQWVYRFAGIQPKIGSVSCVGDMIIATLPGRTIALSKLDGTLLWETKVAAGIVSCAPTDMGDGTAATATQNGHFYTFDLASGRTHFLNGLRDGNGRTHEVEAQALTFNDGGVLFTTMQGHFLKVDSRGTPILQYSTHFPFRQAAVLCKGRVVALNQGGQLCWMSPELNPERVQDVGELIYPRIPLVATDKGVVCVVGDASGAVDLVLANPEGEPEARIPLGTCVPLSIGASNDGKEVVVISQYGQTTNLLRLPVARFSLQ